MKPGAYVLSRPIDNPLGLSVQHQFVVLVPADPGRFAAELKDVGGTRCSVLGAYNVDGFLRAERFAASDMSYLGSKISAKGDSRIQLSKIEPQVCLVGTEDPFLACFCKAFDRYKSFQGKSGIELRYPTGVSQHLSPYEFNSNSWAQSLIFWPTVIFSPAKYIRNFNGLDVGNSRLIARKYFIA